MLHKLKTCGCHSCKVSRKEARRRHASPPGESKKRANEKFNQDAVRSEGQAPHANYCLYRCWYVYYASSLGGGLGEICKHRPNTVHVNRPFQPLRLLPDEKFNQGFQSEAKDRRLVPITVCSYRCWYVCYASSLGGEHVHLRTRSSRRDRGRLSSHASYYSSGR